MLLASRSRSRRSPSFAAAPEEAGPVVDEDVGAADCEAGVADGVGDVGAGGIGWALSGAIAATVGVVVASGLVVDEVLVGLFGLPPLPSFVGHALDMCCLLPHVQHLPWRCFRSTS